MVGGWLLVAVLRFIVVGWVLIWFYLLDVVLLNLVIGVWFAGISCCFVVFGWFWGLRAGLVLVGGFSGYCSVLFGFAAACGWCGCICFNLLSSCVTEIVVWVAWFPLLGSSFVVFLAVLLVLVWVALLWLCAVVFSGLRCF